MSSTIIARVQFPAEITNGVGVGIGSSPHVSAPFVDGLAGTFRSSWLYGSVHPNVIERSHAASAINSANARQTQDVASKIAQSVMVTGEAYVPVAADFFNTPTPATYRVFRSHYLCVACPLEWSDEGCVIGPSFCPCCDAEHEPYASESLLEEA